MIRTKAFSMASSYFRSSLISRLKNAVGSLEELPSPTSGSVHPHPATTLLLEPVRDIPVLQKKILPSMRELELLKSPKDCHAKRLVSSCHQQDQRATA